MKPFVINRYGRIVFPFNFVPAFDFSVFDSLDQSSGVIGRDFEEKAPPESDIVGRIHAGGYKTRYELLRDLALTLFWANRYGITLYEKRPTRWRDVPRFRDEVFLPVFKASDMSELSAAVDAGYRALGTTWDEGVEDKAFRILFDVFRHRKWGGAELPAIKPTVAEAAAPGHGVPAHRGAQALHRHAAAGGARRAKGRAGLHQRGPDPQRRLVLVADDRRGDSSQDRDRPAALHRSRPRSSRPAGGAAGAREVGPASGRDRCRHLLLVHEREDDAVGGHLALRPARDVPDTRLLRRGGRLRGPALWTGRGGPPAAGSRAAGPGRLRREVLGQDRNGAHVTDDLRRRRGCAGGRAGRAWRRARRRGVPDLRERAHERSGLDRLAQPGVRQQHHRVRTGSPQAREAVPGPDAVRAPGASPSRRRRRHADGRDRADRAAPGQSHDGRAYRGRRGAGARELLLQHRDGGQHVVGLDSHRAPRRDSERRHRPPPARLRSGLRRRRGRWVRRHERGSRNRSVAAGVDKNAVVVHRALLM